MGIRKISMKILPICFVIILYSFTDFNVLKTVPDEKSDSSMLVIMRNRSIHVQEKCNLMSLPEINKYQEFPEDSFYGFLDTTDDSELTEEGHPNNPDISIR